MADVFVSYARQDAEVANRIVEYLRQSGVDVWYDRELRAGENWPGVIADQLERADAVLVLVSPASLQSQWVQREWAAALGQSVRLIPVLVQGSTFADLPAPLSTLQAVDLNQYDPRELERLVEAVVQLRSSPAAAAIAAIDVERIVEDITARVVERLGPAAQAATPAPPEEEPALIFVICSYDEAMEPIFEAITDAARAVGMRAERVKDVPGDFRITDQMLSMIRRARLVVADLTHERPNVYFELGYARGIGKPIVTISRKGRRSTSTFRIGPTLSIRTRGPSNGSWSNDSGRS